MSLFFASESMPPAPPHLSVVRVVDGFDQAAQNARKTWKHPPPPPSSSTGWLYDQLRYEVNCQHYATLTKTRILADYLKAGRIQGCLQFIFIFYSYPIRFLRPSGIKTPGAGNKCLFVRPSLAKRERGV